MGFIHTLRWTAAGIVFLGLLQTHAFAEKSKRSFRPIVPIKQNVTERANKMVTQSVTIAIPPPPIPKPDSSTNQDTILEIPKENGTEPLAESPEKREAPRGSGIPESDAIPESPPVEAEKGDEGKNSSPGSNAKPAADDEPSPSSDGPTLERLRNEAHRLASRGLTYKFGAANPDTGGLDCSGAMQHLLTNLGIKGVPRTSYDQYYWLKRQKLLDDVYGKGAEKKLFKKLSPGDLIFWGGTWKSGHRVSHVMLYMGYDPTADKHYVFGARGKSSKGMLGNGVDLFELDPTRGRLIAHGKIPGLQY